MWDTHGQHVALGHFVLQMPHVVARLIIEDHEFRWRPKQECSCIASCLDFEDDSCWHLDVLWLEFFPYKLMMKIILYRFNES